MSGVELGEEEVEAEKEEGGGCTRKQSSFVLKMSGRTGVRSKIRFKREVKKRKRG